MKKRIRILIMGIILIFASGAFLSSGVLRSEIPPLLKSTEIVVNPDMTVGFCCVDGNFMCECENCPGQCD